MPELPEVETIRNDLAKMIQGKVIKDLEIRDKAVIKSDVGVFKKSLLKNKIKSIDRVGKLLIFNLQTNGYLLVHLKMTGQLVYKQGKKIIAGGHSLGRESDLSQALGGELPNKHTRAIFTFKDGSKLYFNDLRKFGYLKVIRGYKELLGVTKGYGMEPLTKSWQLENFKNLIKKRKTNIKAVLLNQKIIAGIGNIYADEILFAAGVRPNRRADSLKNKEIEKIFKLSEIILKQAIKYRGTTFSSYIDASGRTGGFVKFLKVYQKGGKKCARCGSEIKRIKLVGRGTHFCEKCQK